MLERERKKTSKKVDEYIAKVQKKAEGVVPCRRLCQDLLYGLFGSLGFQEEAPLVLRDKL